MRQEFEFKVKQCGTSREAGWIIYAITASLSLLICFYTCVESYSAVLDEFPKNLNWKSSIFSLSLVFLVIICSSIPPILIFKNGSSLPVHVGSPSTLDFSEYRWALFTISPINIAFAIALILGTCSSLIIVYKLYCKESSAESLQSWQIMKAIFFLTLFIVACIKVVYDRETSDMNKSDQLNQLTFIQGIDLRTMYKGISRNYQLYNKTLSFGEGIHGQDQKTTNS